MQIAFRNDFGQLFKAKGLNGYAIEIGVAEATFSKVLVSTCDFKKIYLLDVWKHFDNGEYNCACNKAQEEQDRIYDGVVTAMKPYGDKVEIIRGDCTVEFKRFPDEYFDYIYIDANHEYLPVKTDMNNWYPKLKIGGVFAGHDYMDGVKRTGVFGVKTAVNEFCKAINVVPFITGATRRCPPSWYWIKE
jgi:hypothetical protein